MKFELLSRTVKLVLLPCLLLTSVLLNGCGDGSGESAGNTASDSSSVAGAPGQGALVDPAAARIDSLKASLFDDPENPQLLSDLGDAFFESQRYQEAIPVYEKAVSIHPANPDILNDLGLSYFYIGDQEKGLDTINRAIAADPVYKHAWLSKGFMLSSLGRHDEAITTLNKVKELDAGGPLAKAADDFLREMEGSLDQGTVGSD